MILFMNNKAYYGSGRFYTDKYDKTTFPMPADPAKITKEEKDALVQFLAAMMNENYQIGYLKDGYKFNVSTNKLEDQSDLGEIKINVINEEKASVQISLFNANAETIAKQYPTARHTAVDGYGITAVGGLNSIDETAHILLFKHDDNRYGDSVVVCIGKNTSGFDAVWKQDSVTPFPCTYEIEPLDNNGTLALFIDCPVGTDWKTLAGTTTTSTTSGT